ncbi:MAG TPA: TCR/Tet family MFS transporter [Magnetospirillaceae bacterium]|jgi:DHA1 family tetracycline resistance protein-like MFS transporter
MNVPPPFDQPTTIAVTGGPRRATAAFVYVTVMLDTLSIGIVLPVLPMLISGFVHGDTVSAARIFGLFIVAWAAMQFLFSPLLGALSDRFGRRRVILASNFCLGIDYVIMALAPTLGWLLFGRLISGVMAASITTSAAYIADVTPPEKRAGSYAMMNAASTAGYMLGPALGGVLAHISPTLPCWIAAVFSIVNGCYGTFVLPESLARIHRAKITWKTANPFGGLVLLGRYRGLIGLMAGNFITIVASVVIQTITVLYTAYRYGWDTRTIGLTMAGIAACGFLVQILLAGRIIRVIGERLGFILGTASGALCLAIYAFAPNGWVFIAATPAMAFWGLTYPSLQSLMTRYVSPSEHGRLQGVNNSLYGVANLIGPWMFSAVFAAFIGPWKDLDLPGAPFILSVMLLAIAIGILISATRPQGQYP